MRGRGPTGIELVVATPDIELETAHARRALPDSITMRDAVFNLQRALLLVHALRSGDDGDLREALRDRWHQPARAALVPGLAEALSARGRRRARRVPERRRTVDRHVHPAAARREPARSSATSMPRLGMPSTIRVLAAHQPAGRPQPSLP